MKKVKKHALLYFGTIVILAVFIRYENRVGVLPIEPPLTGWQRSVVQDGPAISARWQKIIERSLKRNRADFPSDIIVGIMLTESMGKPRAIHPKTGAAGLLGIKPVVCKALKVRKCNLLNPHENVALGVQYLSLLKKYGFKDEKLILAYGVGPARAREIFKTKRFRAHRSVYVRKVLYARGLGRIYSDS
jgi:soluble lytic murein transglycosylase-like protein